MLYLLYTVPLEEFSQHPRQAYSTVTRFRITTEGVHWNHLSGMKKVTLAGLG